MGMAVTKLRMNTLNAFDNNIRNIDNHGQNISHTNTDWLLLRNPLSKHDP